MESLKSRAIDWLFQQGISTVLLLLLVYGLGHTLKHVVPDLLRAVQAGYERVADEHHAHVRLLIEEFRADQERDQRLLERLLSEEARPYRRVTDGSPPRP